MAQLRTFGVGVSDTGRSRESNEDVFLADDDLQLYIACDGMGGHAAGEVAADLATRTVGEFIGGRRDEIDAAISARATEPVVELVKEAIRYASHRVLEAAEEDQRQGMGCAMTLVLIAGSRAVMGHVGDTRLYLIRDAEAHQLSTDHTVTAELVRSGVIAATDAEGHPYAHVLSRAVGTHDSVLVDTHVIDVEPGDRFLLCSDGFAQYVTGSKRLAEQVLALDLDREPRELVELANEAGGSDNITVVVVGVDRPDGATGTTERGEAQVQIDALGSAFLFAKLDFAQLTRVLEETTDADYKAGDVVLSAGDPCSSLFIVTSGAFEVVRPDGHCEVLELGDCVGATTLLAPRASRASLRCRDRGSLLRLERDALFGLARKRPWLGVALLERLGKRVGHELEQLREGRPEPRGSRF